MVPAWVVGIHEGVVTKILYTINTKHSVIVRSQLIATSSKIKGAPFTVCSQPRRLIVISKPRTRTRNKELLLEAILAHPGLFMSQLAKLSGVPIWAAQKILPEFAGRRLVYSLTDETDRFRRKRWYPLVAENSVDSKPQQY